MRALSARRWILLLAAVAIWLVVSACSCSTVVERLSERNLAKDATATAVQARRARDETAASLASITKAPSETPFTPPTATPSTPSDTATPRPTATATSSPALAATMPPVPAVQSLSDFVLPSQPNQKVTVIATQDEINDLLQGQVFEMPGILIRDVSVILNPGEIIADLQGTYVERGISSGVRLRGVPQVHDGQAYVKILEVKLDQSLPGLVRLAVQRMIHTAIQQNETEHGIAIPIEGVEVLSAKVDSQLLTIEGITR